VVGVAVAHPNDWSLIPLRDEFQNEIIAWLVTELTGDEHFSHKTSEEESASHSGLFYEQTGHSRHDTVSQDDVAR
jgi:hypothetical protein